MPRDKFSFSYLQDTMPEDAVCMVERVPLLAYLGWRLRGWVTPVKAYPALGVPVPGFKLTQKGRDADARPPRARAALRLPV